MRTRFTEHAHHARQRRLRSGAHVQRLDGQPHRVDADHRSSSRSQAAHSAAATNGQSTFTIVAPRRSSIVICLRTSRPSNGDPMRTLPAHTRRLIKLKLPEHD